MARGQLAPAPQQHFRGEDSAAAAHFACPSPLLGEILRDSFMMTHLNAWNFSWTSSLLEHHVGEVKAMLPVSWNFPHDPGSEMRAPSASASQPRPLRRRLA